jgi:cysteine-rich secretory family protein
MRCAVLVVLVACGGGDSGVDAPPGGQTAKQFCVSETNRYRSMNGKPALAESAALEMYADTGAMVDFTSSPHTHFTQTQGGGISDAENECPVQGNWMLPPGGDMNMLVGQCIAAFYSEGPGGGHYENMMSANTKLGCGIYQMGTGVTIVQDYGP